MGKCAIVHILWSVFFFSNADIKSALCKKKNNTSDLLFIHMFSVHILQRKCDGYQDTNKPHWIGLILFQRCANSHVKKWKTWQNSEGCLGFMPFITLHIFQTIKKISNEIKRLLRQAFWLSIPPAIPQLKVEQISRRLTTMFSARQEHAENQANNVGKMISFLLVSTV